MEDGREGRDSLTESVGRDCWRRTFLIVIVIVIVIVIAIAIDLSASHLSNNIS